MRNIRVFILTIVVLLAASCKKYEDGPVFSLFSKKSRVVNTWVLDSKVFKIGTASTEFKEEKLSQLELKSDYTYESSVISTGAILSTGKWDFDDNKENIIFQEEGSNSFEDRKILRLKSDEMWLQEAYEDGSKMEYHYISK